MKQSRQEKWSEQEEKNCETTDSKKKTEMNSIMLLLHCFVAF